MHAHRYIIPLLIPITLLVFWRAASAQFVSFDDPIYVVQNPHVLQGLTSQSMAWAFTNSDLGYSHPLTWLSMMLDTQLQGAGPRGYHVTNILLHALAVVLLYLALHSLTAAPWRSALVALLFAIHPLRVESVAWISERKDVLSGSLAFATMLAYAAYAHRPHWSRYLLVTIFFALGLMAKPTLVTLPCLLFLLDIWPLRRFAAPPLPPPSPQAIPCPTRSATWMILEKVPLLILAAADSAITYMLQNNVGAIHGKEKLPLAGRLLDVPIAYVLYLVKMVWFQGITLFYPFPNQPHWQVAGAIVLLLTITAAVLIRLRAYPWLALGWFWYLGMLVPVVGLVPISTIFIADRYTYIPAIGLLIMLVWSLPQRLFQTTTGRIALSGATLVIATVLCGFTWRQIGYWQDSATLFKNALRFSPHDAGALMGMGMALDQDLGEPKQALPYFQEAVQNAPDSAFAQCNLGSVEMTLDQLDEALRHLGKAVQIQPNFAAAYNNMGVIYMRRNQFDLALNAFQQTVNIDPGFIVAHDNLGDLLFSHKRFAEALVQYQQASRLDPDHIDYYFLIAKSLANLGRYQEAAPLFARSHSPPARHACGLQCLGPDLVSPSPIR